MVDKDNKRHRVLEMITAMVNAKVIIACACHERVRSDKRTEIHEFAQSQQSVERRATTERREKSAGAPVKKFSCFRKPRKSKSFHFSS
jgi:hypothetical protein